MHPLVFWTLASGNRHKNSHNLVYDEALVFMALAGFELLVFAKLVGRYVRSTVQEPLTS